MYMIACCRHCNTVQESVERQGVSALNLSLDFDEVAVLRENMNYLHNTLEVSQLRY